MKLALLLFLLLLFLFSIFYFKKLLNIKNKKEIFRFNKRNFYSWMNLSKKERYDLSKRDSISYLSQRKNLLEKIRNEYKDISKNN